MVDLSLICQARYTISSQLGCCGIGTVARLRACYPDPTTIRLSLESWEAAGDRRLLRTTYDAMKPLIQSIQRWPYEGKNRLNPIYSMPRHYFAATSLDADIMYASVLEDMLLKRNYILWFFSDNVSRQGDVHLGAFTTRGFVKWLQDHNLGQMQTSGPIESKRTRSDIQGWLVTLNWHMCEEVVQVQKERLRAHIKEWNSNGNIKESAQRTIRTHVTESRELTARFGAAWEE